MRVYIAGPYTKGDTVANIRNAIMAADAIAAKNHVPFVPHLTHFWHLISPHPIEFWYDWNKSWLYECDALLRLPGESIGADLEVETAEAERMPVYHSIDEIPNV